MITSGKYAGYYIAVNSSKVAVVSKNPTWVNEQTMVSFMYQNDVQDVAVIGYGATGDAVAVQNWLTTLKGAGMSGDDIFSISITWRDGAVSFANVTSTQFSAVFATKMIQNPQYAYQQPIAPNPTPVAKPQYAPQKPTGTSGYKPTPPNAAKEAEKKFFGMLAKTGLSIGIGGAALICLVSLALYGKIYMFDGYEFTGWLWIICFLFIAIGIVGILGAIGKEKVSKGVAIVIIGIVIISLLATVGNFFSGCNSGSSNKDGHLVTGTCSHCHGSGRTSYGKECGWCNGTGYWAYYD